MNLRPLANLLVNNGIGVLGENIFMNMLPANAEEGILLRNPLTGTQIDYELDGYFKTEFQLIVRGHSYESVLATTNAATDALKFNNETLLDTMHFKYARPRTKPVAFPLSDGNLIEFNVMFDVCFVET